MKSSVNIAKHPIHPILVLLPVGMWIASLIFDIVYLGTRNPFWHDAAYWNILIGVIAASVAAIAGMTDLFTLAMRDEAKRIGWTHMTLNVTIIVLFIINLVIRAQTGGALSGGALFWTFALNIIAIGTLLVSGWLGGEMVYKWGVAVPEETAERLAPVSRPEEAARMEPEVAGAKGGEAQPEEGEEQQG